MQPLIFQRHERKSCLFCYKEKSMTKSHKDPSKKTFNETLRAPETWLQLRKFGDAHSFGDGDFSLQKHLPADEAQCPPAVSAARQAEEQSHPAPEPRCAAAGGGKEQNLLKLAPAKRQGGGSSSHRVPTASCFQLKKCPLNRCPSRQPCRSFVVLALRGLAGLRFKPITIGLMKFHHHQISK